MRTALDEFRPDQVARMRAGNERRFRGWTAAEVIRLHRRTLRDTTDPQGYLDAMREHLATGVYSRLYPPLVVEASRRFLAQADRAAR